MRQRRLVWIRSSVPGWAVVVPSLIALSLGALTAGALLDQWWRGGLGAFGGVWVVFGGVARVYGTGIKSWRPRLPRVAVASAMRVAGDTPIALWCRAFRVEGSPEQRGAAAIDLQIPGHIPVALQAEVCYPECDASAYQCAGLLWVASEGQEVIVCHTSSKGTGLIAGGVLEEPNKERAGPPVAVAQWHALHARIDGTLLIFSIEGDDFHKTGFRGPVPPVARVKAWSHGMETSVQVRNVQILFVAERHVLVGSDE